MKPVTPYRIFNTRLARRRMVTPNMARLTFAAPEVARMATHAPDQRIKMFFPKADGAPTAIPDQPDWYDLYRAAPPAERPPMRTYTIRALRAEAGEVDIDFALHGRGGPASRWALDAEPGAPMQISAPNAESDATTVGFEWKPPTNVETVLLIGDETALPALAGILEDLATWSRPPRAEVFVETPTAEDRQDLPEWSGLTVEWMTRDGAGDAPEHGEGMIRAAERASLPEGGAAEATTLREIDPDTGVLWESATAADRGFYGWIAGETAAVAQLRTRLIRERRIDRRRLTMMGYWRKGKEEA